MTTSETAARVLLHLTKTAGGTLKTALWTTDGINVEFIYGPADKDRVRAMSKDGLDLIYGHVVYGIHDEIGLDDATRYMCFMRHPVTRTISHYHHLYNVERGPIGDKIRQSENIDEFFDELSHWEFNNFMCKVISGLGKTSATDDELFEAAKSAIDERFDFIGFQEYFPLSLKALSSHLGKPIKPASDINVGKYSLNAVGDRTLDTITSLNLADIRLYKYALEKFL